MNIFGFEFRPRSGDSGNGKYVSKELCHLNHFRTDEKIGSLEKNVESVKSHIDTRIEDLKYIILNKK